ncbi:unnamed protein product [Amoebophrya sp. A120]|nr:unnamed protein product [Amoebophrya sp. A120]|eukprot:GSA120T00014610001.1
MLNLRRPPVDAPSSMAPPASFAASIAENPGEVDNTASTTTTSQETTKAPADTAAKPQQKNNAGTTNPGTGTALGEQVMRKVLQDLIAQKDKLERNIEILTEFLTAPNMPGLTGNLLDAEGFPRADIDLYQVRDARNKIACYQNDHKAVMRKIDQSLQSLHALSRVSVPIANSTSFASGLSSNNNVAGSSNKLKLRSGPPFAVIDKVFPGSPAEEAGVLPGDLVKRFGTVTLGQPKTLTVADCFREIKTQVVAGQAVVLLVERDIMERKEADASSGGNELASLNLMTNGPQLLLGTRNNGALSSNPTSANQHLIAAPMLDAAAATTNTNTTAQELQQPVLATVQTTNALSGREERELELIPRSWSGTGLLGCHIVPLDA